MGLNRKHVPTMENIHARNDNVLEIKENGDRVIDRLHPKTPRRFVSILGPAYSLWNVMYLLNKGPKYFKYLRRDINGVIKEVKGRNIHVPHYWEIIELITFDRVLSEPQLVEELQSLSEDDVNKRWIICDIIHTGVVTTYVENDKFKRLSKIYKKITRIVREHPLPEDKEKYKEWRLAIKEKEIDEIFNRIDNEPLLSGIAETSNEDVKAKYLS